MEYLIDLRDERVRDALTAFLGTTVARHNFPRRPRADDEFSSLDGTPSGVALAVAGADLGRALAWLLVNRRTTLAVSVERVDGRGDTLRLSPPTIDVPVERANAPLAAGSHGCDPADCVETYHLHAHFDAAAESAALALLESTQNTLRAAGVLPLHSHVWHSKNGPHDPWSWELWVETAAGLGVAVAHFMAARAHERGLRLCFHADTDQE